MLTLHALSHHRGVARAPDVHGDDSAEVHFTEMLRAEDMWDKGYTGVFFGYKMFYKG